MRIKKFIYHNVKLNSHIFIADHYLRPDIYLSTDLLTDVVGGIVVSELQKRDNICYLYLYETVRLRRCVNLALEVRLVTSLVLNLAAGHCYLYEHGRDRGT